MPVKQLTIDIKKVDIDRRIVTAITNVVSDGRGNPVIDKQGDVIKAENLEDVFIETFAKGGADAGGEMHVNDGGADVVQHFVFCEKDWQALDDLFGRDLKHMPEFGIVKFRVTDDDLWAKVKAGFYPEVSIEGEGTREDM